MRNLIPLNQKTTGLFAGIAFFLIIFLSTNLDPENAAVTNTLAVAVLMAIWWMTEAVPLAVTSLLPVALFPIMGVMNGKDVSTSYFNHIIFLFIGGFLIALAMQKWDLHKRIALKILMVTGSSYLKILLGFMLATAFLSMWISNTATAMMMIPIALSIIHKLEESIDKSKMNKYSLGLLLSIAYAASIGGIATLVGTPPNLSFARIFTIYFPDAPSISFANWMLFALPISIILFFITWLYLYFIFKPKNENQVTIAKSTFQEQYNQLGKISREEIVVLVIFVATALLWLTRKDLNFGSFTIPGWENIFSSPKFINDGTVAIFMAILLFVIPSKERGERIMNWEAAKGLPWNIVLLFGGGFALASGFKESGLSMWFGEQLSFTANFHPIFVILSICFMITFLTELTSNTATTEMFLPILAGLAVATKTNPLLFMVPATISASMAFMLPVATPPNAIAFGTNRIRMMDMAKTGIWLNLIGVVIITLVSYFLGQLVFDIVPSEFPDWASFDSL